MSAKGQSLSNTLLLTLSELMSRKKQASLLSACNGEQVNNGPEQTSQHQVGRANGTATLAFVPKLGHSNSSICMLGRAHMLMLLLVFPRSKTSFGMCFH